MLGPEREVVDFLAMAGLSKTREFLQAVVERERIDGLVLDHLDRQELQQLLEVHSHTADLSSAAAAIWGCDPPRNSS